jgi:RNA polymerase sigma-70 factor (ECF subfamily)
MSSSPRDQGPKLEDYRPYLRMLARLHWDERLQGRMDPSDLVHDTLEEAWRKLDQYRGSTEAEFAGWLRTALVHNLVDARNKVLGKQGDRAREVVLLEAAMNESSSRVNALLAAEQPSPSERASQNEEFRRLENALTRLPPDQQEAVRLHHLQGMSSAELAQRLGRSEASVAGLLRRGLARLREYLQEPE